MGINPWDCKPMGARRRSLRGGKLAYGQVDISELGKQPASGAFLFAFDDVTQLLEIANLSAQLLG